MQMKRRSAVRCKLLPSKSHSDLGSALVCRSRPCGLTCLFSTVRSVFRLYFPNSLRKHLFNFYASLRLFPVASYSSSNLSCLAKLTMTLRRYLFSHPNTPPHAAGKNPLPPRPRILHSISTHLYQEKKPTAQQRQMNRPLAFRETTKWINHNDYVTSRSQIPHPIMNGNLLRRA
jgi:hypothetical protein